MEKCTKNRNTTSAAQLELSLHVRCAKQHFEPRMCMKGTVKRSKARFAHLNCSGTDWNQCSL